MKCIMFNDLKKLEDYFVLISNVVKINLEIII